HQGHTTLRRARHCTTEHRASLFWSPWGERRRGRVTEIYVYWKHRTPGDAVVAPGHRISGVALRSTLPELRDLLGEGFFHVQQGDAEVFHWPHLAIAIILKQGRLWRVTGFYDEGTGEWGCRYRTDRGVGIKSTSQELRAAFGEPVDRRKILGRVEEWEYPTIGLAAGIAMGGSLQGHASTSVCLRLNKQRGFLLGGVSKAKGVTPFIDLT